MTMNNIHPTHILTQMGVLSSFSISKKMTENDITAMMKKTKNKVKSESELIELVKTKIMSEILEATENGTIPGIIVDKNKSKLFSIKSMESLNKMVDLISGKLNNKKLDKLSLCYFINYLIGKLNLTEEDFEDFYNKFTDSDDGSELDE